MCPFHVSAFGLLGVLVSMAFGGCGGGDSLLPADPLSSAMRSTGMSPSPGSPTVRPTEDGQSSGPIQRRYAELARAIQQEDLAAIENLFSRDYMNNGIDYDEVIAGFRQSFEDHQQAKQHISAVFDPHHVRFSPSGEYAWVSGDFYVVPKVARPSFSVRAVFPESRTPDCWRRESDGVWRRLGNRLKTPAWDEQ